MSGTWGDVAAHLRDRETQLRCERVHHLSNSEELPCGGRPPLYAVDVHREREESSGPILLCAACRYDTMRAVEHAVGEIIVERDELQLCELEVPSASGLTDVPCVNIATRWLDERRVCEPHASDLSASNPVAEPVDELSDEPPSCRHCGERICRGYDGRSDRTWRHLYEGLREGQQRCI